MNLLASLIVAPLLFSSPSVGVYREPVHVCQTGMLAGMNRCIDNYDVVKYPYHRVLASHNYKTGRYWSGLKVGDKFRYNSKVYRIYDRKVVTPKDVKVLNAEEDELRLLTCTKGEKNRLIVYGREI